MFEALGVENMRTKEIDQRIVALKTNRDSQKLELSRFEIFRNGSFKCFVSLDSRGFCLNKEMYFDNGIAFVEALEKMDQSLSGEAELKEDYQDHFLKFSMTPLGHLLVSGTFVEYSEHSQSLSFEFEADQTCLASFTSSLKNIIQ